MFIKIKNRMFIERYKTEAQMNLLIRLFVNERKKFRALKEKTNKLG